MTVECKSCGGEMYPDTFEHPRKPVEWIMRCRNCGDFEQTTQDEVMLNFPRMYPDMVCRHDS